MSIRDSREENQVSVQIVKGKQKQKKTIKNDDDFEQVWAHCRDGECKIDLCLDRWESWSTEFAFKVACLVTRLDSKCAMHFGKKRLDGCGFVAILKIEPGIAKDDLSRFAKFKNLLLIFAAAQNPDVFEQLASLISTRLKHLGFRSDVRTIAKEIRNTAAELFNTNDSDDDLVPIKSVSPDCPVSSEMVIPSDYSFVSGGILQGREKKPFFSTQVAIKDRYVDVNTGQERVEIAFKRDKKWKLLIVQKKQISDARMIVDLANEGLPVNSNNSSDLVTYLADFEAANLEFFEVKKVTGKLGYHGSGGQSVFVLPKECISNSGEEIQFCPADEGIRQATLGYDKKGSIDESKYAIEFVVDFPKLLFAIAAGLAPVLRAFIKFPNMVIDFAGRTSGAKTILLRFVASLWGNPNEHEQGSVLQSWAFTKTYLERIAGICSHLPLIVDDSKQASFTKLVAEIVYMVSEGQGKGRGNVTGLQASEFFSTIMITNGERPITSFTKDGGTRSRTFSSWGSPFGEFSPEMGEVARLLNDLVCSNYGHIGPAFVGYVLNNHDCWKGWSSEFEMELQKYTGWAQDEDNQFAARMAPTLAAISTTFWLLIQSFGLKIEYFDLVDVLWNEICAGAAEADQSKEALCHVYSVSCANLNHFERSRNQEFSSKVENWGVWHDIAPVPASVSPGECDSWSWIGFHKHILVRILDEVGYDSDAVIKTWNDNGWLIVNEKDRLGRKTRMANGKSARLIAISRIAFKAAGAF